MEALQSNMGIIIAVITVVMSPVIFFIVFRIENRNAQSKIQRVLDSIVERDKTVDERARDWQRHMDKSTSALESISNRMGSLEAFSQKSLHTLDSIDKSQLAITHTQERLLERLSANDAQHAKLITMLERESAR